MADSLRLGTRNSPLARWQADWAATQLRAHGIATQIVPITTQGDDQSASLRAFGGVGLFTKAIQLALLNDEIDLAVHSLKDLPTHPIDGLCLAAVPKRESVRDVIISRSAGGLDGLPANAQIGTGSPRRQAQLLHHRGDLRMLDIRGNVDTRLRKLSAGEYDAIVLAEAGLRRLGIMPDGSQIIPMDLMLPAVGQGALAIECREDAAEVRECLAVLEDPISRQSVLAERTLLGALRAGCLAPVGAWARVEATTPASETDAIPRDTQLQLSAVVLSADGQQRLDVHVSGPLMEAASLGRQAAEQLFALGAERLISAAHEDPSAS